MSTEKIVLFSYDDCPAELRSFLCVGQVLTDNEAAHIDDLSKTLGVNFGRAAVVCRRLTDKQITSAKTLLYLVQFGLLPWKIATQALRLVCIAGLDIETAINYYLDLSQSRSPVSDDRRPIHHIFVSPPVAPRKIVPATDFRKRA